MIVRIHNGSQIRLDTQEAYIHGFHLRSGRENEKYFFVGTLSWDDADFPYHHCVPLPGGLTIQIEDYDEIVEISD